MGNCISKINKDHYFCLQGEDVGWGVVIWGVVERPLSIK